MVMWFKYDKQKETRLRWLESCMVSGGKRPLWASMLLGLNSFVRGNKNRISWWLSQWRQEGRLRDNDLVYASSARCPCGAGMAYHKGCGPWGYWECSAILKGTASHDIQHEAKLPFMFYEIKSENQPSAYGSTTRPGVKSVRIGWNGAVFEREANK